jgi:hypothetical protein
MRLANVFCTDNGLLYNRLLPHLGKVGTRTRGVFCHVQVGPRLGSTADLVDPAGLLPRLRQRPRWQCLTPGSCSTCSLSSQTTSRSKSTPVRHPDPARRLRPHTC